MKAQRRESHPNKAVPTPNDVAAARRTAQQGAKHAGKEFELKFGVSEPAREALMQALEKERFQSSLLISRYYDLPDGRLAAAGISLRLRHDGQGWYQTLKVKHLEGIQDRLEHELEVPAPGNGASSPDISLHEGTAAGDALGRVMQDDRQALAERYRTEVVRRSRVLTEGDTRIEVAFDLGRVAAGEREESVCELEFELKRGTARSLCTFARAWVGRYGLWLSAESKSARGERLLGGCNGMPVVKASQPCLDGSMSGATLLRAIVRSCTDQIISNAAAVAAGSVDHDHIHQLRVGLRRLRTAIRELGDLSDGMDSGWEAPMTDVFRQLGIYRDREAVLETIRPKLLEAGASGVAWMEERGATVDPVLAVRNPEFQTALLDVLGFSLDSPHGQVAEREASEMPGWLGKRLKSLHRRVVDDGVRFKKLSESAQHQVRKRLKRLRYLSEFVAPLFERRSVDAYLDNLRPAQDALGKHNDYVVARDMARQSAARGDMDAEFAVRWLDKQQEHSVKASRQALKDVNDGPRFWKTNISVH